MAHILFPASRRLCRLLVPLAAFVLSFVAMPVALGAGTVSFTAPSFDLPEAGEVTVSLDFIGSSEDFTITLEHQPMGGASPFDYQLDIPRFIFSGGPRDYTHEFTVSGRDDDLDDNLETILVSIRTDLLPAGITTGDYTSTIINIIDDDNPIISIDMCSDVIEGSDVVCILSRVGDYRPLLEVDLRLFVSSTSIVGPDSIPMSVTFPENSGTATLRIPTTEDMLSGPLGIITVLIDPRTDYDLSTDYYAIITVMDNDSDLSLVVDPVTADDTISHSEYHSGFSISGTVGVAGASVLVDIGSQSLSAISTDDGTWSIVIPQQPSYISEPSASLSVTAVKPGYATSTVIQTLAVDITPPASRSYIAPSTLQVGVPIGSLSPSPAAGLDVTSFSAAGLLPGLVINPSTGVVSGTPTLSTAAVMTVTVTMRDAFDNTSQSVFSLPVSARGFQTISGLLYTPSETSTDGTVPTVTSPTGHLTQLLYWTVSVDVCSVDSATGALTIEGSGQCLVTATAMPTLNYESASISFSVVIEPENEPPQFVNEPVVRQFAESVGDAVSQVAIAVGDPVSASDPESDLVSYSIEGEDADLFSVVSSTGQIFTRIGLVYDYESVPTYSVQIRGDDGEDEAVVSVSIQLVDVDEPPLAPAAPSVASVAGSPSSLLVTWLVPDSTARPAASGYDVRYRVSPDGSWSDPVTAGADLSFTLPSLSPATLYDVSVRARSDEGTGPWSISDNARTAGTIPGSPFNFSVMRGSDDMTLVWMAPNNDGGDPVLRYEYRYRLVSGLAFGDWVQIVDGSDPGADPGDERRLVLTTSFESAAYRFDLRAVNVSGPGSEAIATAGSVAFLCSSPDLSGRRLVWSGVLDVDTIMSNTEKTGYGWFGSTGSLWPIDFQLGGVSHRFDLLMMFDPDPGLSLLIGYSSGDLVMSLDTPLPDNTAADMILHVCDEDFALSDGGFDAGDVDYYWESSTLDWSSSGARSVALSMPTVGLLAARGPAGVIGAPIVSGPNAGSMYSTGELITADVRLSGPVSINTASGRPTLGLVYGDRRIEALYQGIVPRNLMRFVVNAPSSSQVVSSIRAVSNGISTNSAVVTGEHGLPVSLRFGSAPGIDNISLAPVAHGGIWSLSDEIDVTLSFEEPVVVDDSQGVPFVRAMLDGTQRTLSYRTGSGRTDLVFSYTVIESDGDVVDVLVVADSLDLGGGSIESTSGLVANLSHDGVSRRGDLGVPTLRSSDVSETEGGSVFFTVILSHPASVETSVSYLTSDGSALSDSDYTPVRGQLVFAPGEVSKTVSVDLLSDSVADPDEDFFLVFLQPSGLQIGTVSVQATVLDLASEAILTASFRSVPAEHDGTASFSVEFVLSEPAPMLDAEAVRNHLFRITGGSFSSVARDDSGTVYTLVLQPSSSRAVMLEQRALPVCGQTGSVCTSDGRSLSGTLSLTIPGPIGISVSDVTAFETPGAKLGFEVTLSRSAVAEVSVDYATRNGMAIFGQDYVMTSGTLTFSSGDTSKTVEVVVIDDPIDEQDEDMYLDLSSVSGASILDASGKGTIINADSLPKAWLALVGRTVGSQLVDAVSDRTRQEDDHLTLGPMPSGGAGSRGFSHSSDMGCRNSGFRCSSVLSDASLRALFSGAAFQVSSGDQDESGAHPVSAWGRFASDHFSDSGDSFSIDGDVWSGLLGADLSRGDLTMGLSVAVSRADGEYRHRSGVGSSQMWMLESDLTTFAPYASMRLGPKWTLWGLGGFGSGDLTIYRQADDSTKMSVPMSLGVGALGARSVLLEPTADRAFSLGFDTDLLWTRTKSESGVDGSFGSLSSASAGVFRARAAFDAGHVTALSNDRSLVSGVEVGLRVDEGDAQTGAGVELGGSLAYRVPQWRLVVEGRGSVLAAHSDEGFKEWGFSGSVRVTPGADGRGLSFGLSPVFGAALPQSDRMWNADSVDVLSSQVGSRSVSGAGLSAQMGYGVRVSDNSGIFTPYVGMGLSSSRSQEYRGGVRWDFSPATDFSIEASTRESGIDPRSSAAFLLRGQARF